ncbi:F-box/kelch-repeat protein [Senna tora]|uniref:F-box/kelch-repeat protein n=1 Tax=Senna tora TaxID=362788 RepID=A0A834T2N9_9FABA|nr:F-box/kelch-repeat protein [Senna tora]
MLTMMTTTTMEENQTQSYGGSPITHIAQDHLFTILLLLPVDAILSLSMTCRRLRALACSDAVWESVCRRDWGSRCVDALKSSNSNRSRCPWMRIYKQVSALDSVYCHGLPDSLAQLDFPTPRASHSLNFLSDCLVLFGGGCEGGRHVDDTWVAYIGTDFRRKLKWHKVNSGIPSGRFGHTCVEMGDFLVLFGGINDNGNRQNDTWIGQVTYKDNNVVTFSWKLLDVGSIAPTPRGAHAACSIDHRRMVIHGGIGLHGLRLGDTWVLELSDTTDSPCSSGTWHEIVTNPCPPARSGHTLTCIGRSRTVVFGGRGTGYEVLDDVWVLDLNAQTWVEIVYDTAECASLSRVGHSATMVLGGRLLIHGGEDSYRHRKDDFWVLDVSAMHYINNNINNNSNNNSSSSNSNSMDIQESTSRVRSNFKRLWKMWRSNGSKCRSFHRACADHSGRYVYVFGGMVDGILQPSESTGLRFDGELFLVELLLHL